MSHDFQLLHGFLPGAKGAHHKFISSGINIILDQFSHLIFRSYGAVFGEGNIWSVASHKFVVRPLCAGEESMEQLEIMGQEILPQFHG